MVASGVIGKKAERLECNVDLDVYSILNCHHRRTYLWGGSFVMLQVSAVALFFISSHLVLRNDGYGNGYLQHLVSLCW